MIGGLSTSLIKFRWPLIVGLADHGYQVYGCAAEPDDDVKSRFKELGGDYFSVPLARAGLNPIKDLQTYWRIRALASSIQPDLVIAYTVKPIVYGLMAARHAGVKQTYALITGLGYAFTDASFSLRRQIVGQLARRLYRASLRKTDHIYFQNPDDQQAFFSLKIMDPDASTSVVNGSGVDLSEFGVAASRSESEFLMIARLVADKGVREYVSAARIIKAKYPEAKFLLAGPLDPNPSAISPQELSVWQENGLIKYLGALNDVRPAIAQASVYVLPSYREGTPRTVLEAMAMGRSIITTDAPGCRETVVPGYNGLLVPPRDSEQLANAMEQAILNPERFAQYGHNSRSLAEEKYDAQKVTSQMLAPILSRTAEF